MTRQEKIYQCSIQGSRNHNLSEQELVDNNMPLVRHIVRKFTDDKDLQDELIQEGSYALIQAIKLFDPNRGVKLSTYAAGNIVGTIRRYFRDKKRKIRLPRRLHELSNALDGCTEKLVVKLGRKPTDLELANQMGIEIHELGEVLRVSGSYFVDSFERTISNEDDSLTLKDTLSINDSTITNLIQHSALWDAVQHLPDPRQAEILIQHFGSNLSQHQIAVRMGISQMYVSRLYRAALRHLKRELYVEDYNGAS